MSLGARAHASGVALPPAQHLRMIIASAAPRLTPAHHLRAPLPGGRVGAAFVELARFFALAAAPVAGDDDGLGIARGVVLAERGVEAAARGVEAAARAGT